MGVELTEADAGVEHAVAMGNEVVVRLEENRTTGFRWQLTDLPDGVVCTEDAFEPPSSSRVGQGGTRTFRLRATAAGAHRVSAQLRRSWEQGAAARSVVFLLRVN